MRGPRDDGKDFRAADREFSPGQNPTLQSASDPGILCSIHATSSSVICLPDPQIPDQSRNRSAIDLDNALRPSHSTSARAAKSCITTQAAEEFAKNLSMLPQPER
jgi:hypothetical protein